MIRETFSHYRMIEELGRGGMGVVYRAEDLRLGRQIALKLLLDPFSSDGIVIERFKREARLAAAINHPNICTVFEVGEFEHKPYIAMELLTGKSVKERLSERSIPQQIFLDWALQTTTALGAAHANGILHRDLKPANLFVTTGNQLKILDFGLSTLLLQAESAATSMSDTTQAALQTATDCIVGTPAYMSPEQIRGDALDTRSDLFSLGVVMYEIATGKLPFEGLNPATVMAAILHDNPSLPSSLNASIRPELDRILLKMLRKDRALRYQSAEDLLSALRELSRNESVRKEPKPYSARAVFLQNGKLAALIMVVFVILAVVCGLTLVDRTPPRILNTSELTHDRLPKAGPLLTDGARVYFSKGLIPFGPYGVSSRGGDSFKIPIGLENARILDYSPSRAEFILRASDNSDLMSVGFHPLPLWVAAVTGGSLRRLGNLAAGAAAWSPDGQSLVYSSEGELDVAKSDGTDTRTLTKVAGQPFAIRWSPDGNLIRFSLTGNPRQIWEVRKDGTRLHPLYPAWSAPQCCGNWTLDGKYYVFQATTNGVSNIWAQKETRRLFAFARPEPVKLTSGPLSSSEPVPSVDGRRIFVNTHQRRSEIVRYDAGSKELLEFLPGLSIEGLDFTRDGEWVAYVTFPEGILWRSRINGQESLQLTQSSMRANLPRWSPDGKQITFMGVPEGSERTAVFLVSAQGGPVRQLTDGSSNTGNDPTWSPDGRLIAVGGSFDDKGDHIIKLLDVATHKLSDLPGSSGNYSPRWSPDGHYLATESQTGDGVSLYSFYSKQWADLTKLPPGFINWSKDSQFVYFDTQTSSPALFRVRVADRKVEKIFDFAGFHQAAGTYGFWHGLAPDGSALFQRDLSLDQIYSLDWDAP